MASKKQFLCQWSMGQQKSRRKYSGSIPAAVLFRSFHPRRCHLPPLLLIPPPPWGAEGGRQGGADVRAADEGSGEAEEDAGNAWVVGSEARREDHDRPEE